MRRFTALMLVAVMIVVVLPVALAMAAEGTAPQPAAGTSAAGEQKAAEPQPMQMFACPMHPDKMATWDGKCPICGMKMQPMGARGRGGMRSEEMSRMPRAMMMRHRMLMMAELDTYDPSALLGAQRWLQLTDAQQGQLKTIADEAGTKAKAVLTEDQLTKLKEMESMPKSMTGMQQKMMEQMKAEKEKAAAGATEGSGMKMETPAAKTAEPAPTPGAPNP